MPSIVTISRGGVGPTYWLDHVWDWEAYDPEGTFNTDTVEIYLDKIGAATPTRKTITPPTTGLTITATRVSVAMPSSWVAANITEGEWRVHFLVNGSQRAWFTQKWVTPAAGRKTPS